MEEEDFWLLYDGWVSGVEYEESLIRMHAAVVISACSMSKNPPSIDKLWPKKKKSKVGAKQTETLRRLKEAEAFKKVRDESSTKGRG